MNELQGAVARAQLRKVKWVVEQRRKVAKSLTEKLEKIEGVKPPTVPEGCKHSYWLYPLRINLSMFKASLEEFAQALKAEGIPATAGYIGKPLYTALIFKEKIGYGGTGCPWMCPLYGKEIVYKEGLCPQTERILNELLTLPCNEFFTEGDVEDVAAAVEKVLNYYRKP